MATTPIDILKSVEEVEAILSKSEDLPPALVAAIKMLITIVKLLADRVNTNSHNSSKPPSTDPNREKKTKSGNGKPPGGQPNHKGSTLELSDDPDEIKLIPVEQARLPLGHYEEAGYERRQVFNIRISRHIIEYRAQILKNEQGGQFKADFPIGLTRPVQYDASVKANAVYMSQFQLIPYDRIQAHFSELFDLPVSAGSLYNFNDEAFKRLGLFETVAKEKLRREALLHVDETGVNINGKKAWLHVASNARWTMIACHAKRGKEAMDAIGILPHFKGMMVHDHWKPYYRYTDCLHILCNAHHKRELTRSHELDGQIWAKNMEDLLDKINTSVKKAGGHLPKDECEKWRKKYRHLLERADIECPPPTPPDNAKKKRWLARSKSRNLLERLRNYEEDVLRFMEDPLAPFTNNQGERDFRMTKVQQKISGCFRSERVCRVRSYLSTCRKQGVGIGEALECLFNGTWPEFIQEEIDGQTEGAE